MAFEEPISNLQSPVSSLMLSVLGLCTSTSPSAVWAPLYFFLLSVINIPSECIYERMLVLHLGTLISQVPYP